MKPLQTLASGRLTKHRICDYLRTVILNETGHDVGILSFEAITGWKKNPICPAVNRYHSTGDGKSYLIEVAYPGKVHEHLVRLFREDGKLVHAKIS